MKRIITGILVLGGASGALGAQPAAAVMDRAARQYTDMRSMRADFTQTITNPLTGTKATSRGVIVRKDPNLLSITFSNPKGDRIVSDGTSLWVYLPSSAPGQVMKMSASGGGSMGMVDPGGLFLSSPSSRFTISSSGSGSIGGRRASILSLVPKGANSPFSRARVWIDAADYSVRQFEVVDANGLTRLVTISNVRANVSVGTGEFRFIPPRNTRVIGGM